ncbi:MAG: tRNA (adenosine(37)-N6)-dimethylallyltransferase MiaA [Patescibacteria group bacterium]
MDLKKDLRKFLKTAKKPLIVVLGPTASGKTDLALKLAKMVKGEIISTDSRQIYRDMDISTDAILEKNQEKIPHHLLRITDPDQTFTLAEYSDLALKTIKAIYKKKKIPLLVGGTGLYISSIIEGYKVPKIAPDKKLREKLTKEAEKKGNEFLYKKLVELDPEAAKTIHPNNLRYVIRALEINMTGGQNKVDDKSKKSPFDLFIVGVEWPREKLYERINKRVDQQIKRGLVKEVETLLKKYDAKLPSMSSLGIKEIVPHVNGKKKLEECVETLKQNTRNYAKRQLTWFRRYDDINWLKPSEVKKI